MRQQTTFSWDLPASSSDENVVPFFLLAVGITGLFFGAKGMHASLTKNANRAAFLAAIRMSEGTARYADPYSIVYGGQLFLDHSDHPANTGEWTGVDTRWGHTSAAGAYQFEVATWNGLGGAPNYGDFSAQSQDQAALDLIAQCGALDAIDSGDIPAAVAKVGSQWASLPSSTAGQPTVALQSFLTSYAANGGKVLA
jgi:muramidase (phage lysozyme)